MFKSVFFLRIFIRIILQESQAFDLCEITQQNEKAIHDIKVCVYEGCLGVEVMAMAS